MKYTKEIPTKPGWYWVRGANDKQVRGIGIFYKYVDESMYFRLHGQIFKANSQYEYSDRFIEEPEE